MAKRRYLTGLDWMMHAVNHASFRDTGHGNVSQVVLELAAPLNPARLRSLLTDFVQKIPLLSGRCRRALNLAPYWKIPSATEPTAVSLTVEDVPAAAGRDAVVDYFVRAVNQIFEHERQYVAFSLLRQGNKAFLGMKFDHRILDARGAEAFLSELNRFAAAGETNLGNVVPESAHLNRWAEKFRAGRAVNRLFLGMKDECPPMSLPIPHRTSHLLPGAFKFRSYDRETSEKIIHLADERAGYLMNTPYLLGGSVAAFHRLFAQKMEGEGAYIVSVNTDGRNREGAAESVFFNHASFLFFKFLQSEAEDLTTLWQRGREQFYENTRDRVPDHFSQAGMLMRILPPRVYSWLMNKLSQGVSPSFVFTCIASGGFEEDEFLGVKVKNVFHTPHVPPVPGIGIFFTSWQGRINMVLSFLEGMLSEEEAEQLIADIETSIVS